MPKLPKLPKTLSLSLLALLVACGGSDTGDLTERYGLEAKAAAWENQMPSVIFPGQQPTCASLIVRFSVRTNQPGLPANIVAKSVTLSKGSISSWTQDVSQTETGQTNATTIEGVARGCSTSSFSEGDVLDVKLLLKAGDEHSEVKTSIQLYYAS